MNAIELSEYLKPIVSACPLWKDKKLCMELIANPVAGGFTQKKLAAEHERVLADYSTLAKTKEQQCKSLTVNVYETSLTSSLDEYIQKIVGRAGMPEDSETFFLIVTAGGDGTSLEVQTALAKIAFDIGGEYSQIIKNRITVFRLPFGTGNDGSDGRTLHESLDLLSTNSHFSLQKAIRVNCRTTDEQAENGKADRSLKVLPPWYAFNIASIGIDAFITHMTNKTKNIFPGNFYKIWIDLACIFYNVIYPSGKATIKIYKDGLLSQTLETSIVFCLLGVSGHRTYGSGQKIIPDDRNVCITKKMSLLKKMMLKEKFKNGTHVDNPLAFFANADKISVQYEKKILTQLDGEVHLLNPKNFPLTMELTEPVIRIIESDNLPYNKGAVPVYE